MRVVEFLDMTRRYLINRERVIIKEYPLREVWQ